MRILHSAASPMSSLQRLERGGAVGSCGQQRERCVPIAVRSCFPSHCPKQEVAKKNAPVNLKKKKGLF